MSSTSLLVAYERFPLNCGKTQKIMKIHEFSQNWSIFDENVGPMWGALKVI